MLEEEAFVVGGMNPSHATVDLYNAIAEGNYPSCELGVLTSFECGLHSGLAQPVGAHRHMNAR